MSVFDSSVKQISKLLGVTTAGQKTAAGSIPVVLPSDEAGLFTDGAAFTSSSTKLKTGAAGVYQSTVTELAATALGVPRLSARRAAITVADCKYLVLTSGTPVPTGSDILTQAGAAIQATDLQIRDTGLHYFVIPLLYAGFRTITIHIYLQTNFDHELNAKIYGFIGPSTPATTLAAFGLGSHAPAFVTVGGGDGVGFGGIPGGAVSVASCYYAIGSLDGRWNYVGVQFSTGIAPTAGEIALRIVRGS